MQASAEALSGSGRKSKGAVFLIGAFTHMPFQQLNTRQIAAPADLVCSVRFGGTRRFSLSEQVDNLADAARAGLRFFCGLDLVTDGVQLGFFKQAELRFGDGVFVQCAQKIRRRLSGGGRIVRSQPADRKSVV